MINIVLAVQNMEASGVIGKTQEIEFKALEGSLSMMSKGACFFRALRLSLRCLITLFWT